MFVCKYNVFLENSAQRLRLRRSYDRERLGFDLFLHFVEKIPKVEPFFALLNKPASMQAYSTSNNSSEKWQRNI